VDALLGAAGLGDIGLHFPAGDPRFKDVSAPELLRITGETIATAGFDVINIDSVVSAQAPRLAAYLPKMRARIAEALGMGTLR
jgi:2-C-methyl-D-erythritol 2,4-cyclodiphosphate synthase